MTTQRRHTVSTLTVTALVFIAGTFIGVRLLTADANTLVEAPTCTDRSVAEGDPLTANLVTVNVFNASERSGLANRVTINLQRQGFLGGQIGNSTSETKPGNVAILTDDPDDPRVQLVAKQFSGEVEFAAPDITVEDGVIVVLGDGFKDLAKDAPTEIQSSRALSICVPTVTLP